MRALGELRKDALAIFHAGLKAVDPASCIRRFLKFENGQIEVAGHSYALASYDRIYVVGAGKASAKMAEAIESLLGDRIEGGVVNVKYGHSLPLRFVRVNEAGHPVPDEAGLRGAREIIELVRQAGERDLVLCLISGGASALMPCPVASISLADKQETTRRLLNSGATIQELNAMRKHLSEIKGGRLARLAFPATVIALVLSDVVGDDLQAIGSGPTVPDQTTFDDCLSILSRYGVRGEVPSAVTRYLEQGMRGKAEETPKPGDPVFRRVHNVIVGSNLLALSAAQAKARQLGYHAVVLSSFVEGETREVAKVHVSIAKEIVQSGQPVQRPACVISGGETTVTVRGSGLGGRNQEFALAAAMALQGWPGVVILSGGTDGTDGPTDAAGAIVDSTTVERGAGMGLVPGEFLRNNDSYRFFKALDDLLITGPTLTNVMDLRLVLVG